MVAEDLLLGQLMAGVLPPRRYRSLRRAPRSGVGWFPRDRSVRRSVSRPHSYPHSVTGRRPRDRDSGWASPRGPLPRLAERENVSCTDLNFTLPVGRVTGLWVPNGSGKTTLVRVLNRSYLPTEGRILVDGTPAEELELDAYRRSVAVFHSEVHLFSGSVAQNVLLGRSDGSQGSGFSRLEDLGFSSFLDRFPARWSDSIGEGGRRLSSGERQVLGLMRALAGSPQVLLVDEGLSGTDAESGRLIIDTLLQYGRKRAVLLVSHDARILRRTDHLLVLAQGRIQAEGLRARFSPTRPQTASWAGVPPVVAP